MISKEEALRLARETVGSDERICLHLTDFETVCVVDVSYRVDPPATIDPEPESASLDADPAEPEMAIYVDNVPTGMSPLLIDKHSGEVFETGSDVLFPAEDYAECYLSCGFPRGTRTERLRIRGLSEHCDLDAAVRLLFHATDLNPKQAKLTFTQLKLGREPEVPARSEPAARQLAADLRELGVDAIQCWQSEFEEGVVGGTIHIIDDEPEDSE